MFWELNLSPFPTRHGHYTTLKTICIISGAGFILNFKYLSKYFLQLAVINVEGTLSCQKSLKR